MKVCVALKKAPSKLPCFSKAMLKLLRIIEPVSLRRSASRAACIFTNNEVFYIKASLCIRVRVISPVNYAHINSDLQSNMLHMGLNMIDCYNLIIGYGRKKQYCNLK